ncbi:glycosyltransferase [Actinoplanes sp. NPDC049668]|uniref:glycosyltransferase n=1 Tax=unclassified Actinoplanes TaxID=2626549 RepID=UPI0033B6B24C
MIRRPRSIGRRWARVTGPRRRPDTGRPHAYYLAIGFPPAAKSCAYRMRETANQLYAAGWDVTVITICQEAWEREFGLDHSLSADVDPGVRIVELPLMREDLDTDVRNFSERRSLLPSEWGVEEVHRHLEQFPEPRFGGWRPALEAALLDLHRRDPADLLVTTCAPYVNLSATWRLWQEHRVPYVVDFRDGWSVDVIGGGEAFTKHSISGRWEAKLLDAAVAVWCVNDPIAQHYRERYPELAEKISVVRNGYDEASVPAVTRLPDPAEGLRFGYLGTLTFQPKLFAAVLDAWRAARADDPLLAGATLDFRGHIGAGSAREDNAYMEMLSAAHADGVRFGGPVPKAEVADVYASWDVILLLVIGGRFMTSGKVYEALASGLPVISAHEAEHDASTVMSASPLWTGAVGFDPDLLAASFRAAARLAREATAEDRAAVRAGALRYARAAQIEPAVRHVTATVLKTPVLAGELSA